LIPGLLARFRMLEFPIPLIDFPIPRGILANDKDKRVDDRNRIQSLSNGIGK
jgi:hypothetical protein